MSKEKKLLIDIYKYLCSSIKAAKRFRQEAIEKEDYQKVIVYNTQLLQQESNRDYVRAKIGNAFGNWDELNNIWNPNKPEGGENE